MISEDHVTLKSEVMAAENSALHHSNILDIKVYIKQKSF